MRDAKSATLTATEIVVVEDEPAIALPLTDRLEREGFRVTHCQDGAAGLRAAARAEVALVVLDLMLPKLGGSDVLRSLRDRGLTVPVICLTAKTGEADRVAHLLAGADDYVTKPFSTDELIARVHAILRRSGAASPAATSVDEPRSVGGVQIDLDGHALVRHDGERHDLSALEAGLLRALLRQRGRAVSRAQLLDEVWGRYAAVSDRTIDFHVKNIRRKLEATPERPELLVTVHGVGYRLTDDA